jgi:nucleoid-associated protein YgaU
MSKTKSATLLAFSLALGLAPATALRANDPAPAAPATPAATPAPAPAPAPAAAEPAPDASADLAKQLAAAEDKLAAALRSYTLLQNENDQLKASAANTQAAAQAAADKTVAEAQITAGRVVSDALSQANAARDEARQLQAQVAALAAENARLRTSLALAGPPPGSTLGNPTRPGAATGVLKPETVVPAPDPVPAARTHTVKIGDSLTKISLKYYGTASRWEEIYQANRAVIKSGHSLPLGATLKIP